MSAVLFVQAAIQKDDGLPVQIKVRCVHIAAQRRSQLIDGVLTIPNEMAHALISGFFDWIPHCFFVLIKPVNLKNVMFQTGGSLATALQKVTTAEL